MTQRTMPRISLPTRLMHSLYTMFLHAPGVVKPRFGRKRSIHLTPWGVSDASPGIAGQACRAAS